LKLVSKEGNTFLNDFIIVEDGAFSSFEFKYYYEEVENNLNNNDIIEMLKDFSIDKDLFKELSEVVRSYDFIAYSNYYEQVYVNMKL